MRSPSTLLKITNSPRSLATFLLIRSTLCKFYRTDMSRKVSPRQRCSPSGFEARKYIGNEKLRAKDRRLWVGKTHVRGTGSWSRWWGGFSVCQDVIWSTKTLLPWACRNPCIDEWLFPVRLISGEPSDEAHYKENSSWRGGVLVGQDVIWSTKPLLPWACRNQGIEEWFVFCSTDLRSKFQWQGTSWRDGTGHRNWCCTRTGCTDTP